VRPGGAPDAGGYARPAMRVVGFSWFVPFDGVPHAGGVYLLRHVEALLAAGHRVTLVAPATTENRAAVPPVGTEVVLVEEQEADRSGTGGRIASLLRPTVLPARFARAVLEDDRVLAAVRGADLLEYQYVEASALHRPLVGRTRSAAPAVCVAHDVVSQSLLRLAQQPGLDLRSRVVRRLRARLGRRAERRQLRTMDLVLVFSEKDARLLARSGVDARVLLPPLADDRPPGPRTPVDERILFVGAFDRGENQDAAAWLLADIWPAVAAAHPGATLELVGANPTAAMRAAGESDPAISVTGYVDDIGPSYAAAALVVVPLRTGAGVKFKVVAAMLEEVPVVTTTVGAEGIADASAGLFVAVEDDAQRFASAVIGFLDDPGSGRRRATAARAYAAERYGRERFRVELDSAYRGLVAAPRARR
jgi:glycosyltransferase involved in cell wall biosynthesis